MSKARQLIAISLLTSLALGAFGTTAQADPQPTPSPSTTAEIYKALQEQYKRDRDQYLQAVRDRDNKMRMINLIFKNAVDKATTDARIAMASATTPEQKNSISATRRNAITQAITLRDSMISGIGPIPTPPAKPDKLAFDKNELKSDSKLDQKGKSKR
jgi:membrane-bound lytic murein transglycosylase B